MHSYPSSLYASQRLNSIRFPAKGAMQVLTTLLVFSLCLFPNLAAAQSPHIYDVPQAGPPGSQTQTVGNGWDPNATIDIYFDSTDVGLVDTDNNGSFGMAVKAPTIRQNGLSIQIPADAVPGQHWITAVERITQLQAQVPFTVRADWPQFHFDAEHAGYNPYENVLSAATVGKLTLRWKHTIPGDVTAAPTVANGIVYDSAVNGDNNLYAFDAGTGALLWSFGGGPLCEPTAEANGVVYYSTCFSPSGHNYVTALDAHSGAWLWSYDIESEGGSPPAVANGIVYVGSRDNNVYAVDAVTGTLRWKYTLANTPWMPTVADGVLYVGDGDYDSSGDHTLYALDATTGTLIWEFAGQWSMGEAPAVANGVVYAVSTYNRTNQSILYALNAKTGALIWTYNLGSAYTPAVANGVVYVPSSGYDNHFYALDAATGALLWKYTTGTQDWFNPPAVANGIVYLGIGRNDSTGMLAALDATTGTILWQYTTGVGVTPSAPAVVNGMVYAGYGNGTVYAFGLPDQQMSEKLSPPERPDPARLTPNRSLQPVKR